MSHYCGFQSFKIDFNKYTYNTAIELYKTLCILIDGLIAKVC